MTIEMKVRKILDETINLSIPVEQIGEEDDLFDLGMDSINSIKVIIAIETEFGFVFEDDDLSADNVRTIKKMVSLIEGRI